ncbi:protein PLASTID REDOX INSENSITIVE 2, chloroplastic-like [Rutidosis leptorrhynchoides]|uniref:protein PLASTID REDOX INSENSITIVE 2, chloroplastic-like n=1 Tax=Rutidosis leptorrhynchoides TaxID=125765 RepID=UPI003A9A222F
MAFIHTLVVTLSSTPIIPSVTSPIANKTSKFATPLTSPYSSKKIRCLSLTVRASPFEKYVYPDPIPEFALHETKKFREELKKKLYKEKDTFNDDLDRVLDTCTELFSEFVHKEYGGPGTLLVDPFTNMLIELKQRKLPGANSAARAALLWAQNYLDHDWQIWNSKYK